MKIGLFFGSFNPIHIGHLIIANTMAENTHLEEVWFVVSPQNPFKKQKSLLHEFDRLDMVEKAIQDNYKLKTCDVEFHLPRPSYTIDTLTVLQEKHPAHEFGLIMGGDNLSHFHKWKNYEQILEYFRLYVYPRPDSRPSDLDKHPKVSFVESPLMSISATFIRKSIKAQKSIRYLVPESVDLYIKEKKFYL
ncbi:nicotinate (nicotinamide) nucleotide adenylyltransferase [uncultured Microscilla sp.]|uniref:nicotinate (nicotinamide) nucleotide adenylyltransferase n=1 Tax=uncultured Microscilla sp. TaxID=432653 RepID=UPI00260D1EE9|nr:nicotinate (nicotinamide) nucleotide adenylyltransferase [uncultured Microscilla sp.]